MDPVFGVSTQAELAAQVAEVRGVVDEDPWIARRRLTFGASDVPALALALGEPPPSDLPDYVSKLARVLFAVKAGLRKAPAAGSAAQRGNEVEAELVAYVNADPFCGIPMLHHATSVPREWLPLVDRHCPRLSATPDAWCRENGRLVNVQVKTDMAGTKTGVPLWWWWQVQAEMAVTGSESTILLYGPGWASYRESDKREPVFFRVERDEAAIGQIRQWVIQGWKRVEEMKKT